MPPQEKAISGILHIPMDIFDVLLYGILSSPRLNIQFYGHKRCQRAPNLCNFFPAYMCVKPVFFEDQPLAPINGWQNYVGAVEKLFLLF
jgi:hypothetical protein